MKKERNLKKKLNLTRETIRSLDDKELGQAAGGAWTDACTHTNRCSDCICTTYNC